MSATITPYLFFGGRCEEALAFYAQALGAEVDMLMRFSDSPDPHPEGMLPAGFEKKVMHVTFKVHGVTLMASDGSSPGTNFAGFSLALSLGNEAEVQQAFSALVDGGTVIMPVGPTFWSNCFGMLTDRFGITWMISIPGT
ncbi:VOC family protein [bacterium]|nr:VOC family protein [bacterium]